LQDHEVLDDPRPEWNTVPADASTGVTDTKLQQRETAHEPHQPAGF